MLPDWWLHFSGSTGSAYLAPWSNADVAAVSLLVFTVGFALAAVFAAMWLLDVAFAALVAGGILVTWPAMVVLSIAALLVTLMVSFLHKWLAPERQARIERQADAIAAPAVADFERDLGKR
ncbi:MAG: hypothetical protein IT518_05910 [Burkholderiales bacterium]|nr:hypothetical protein [Burkholderiales bacterium]